MTSITHSTPQPPPTPAPDPRLVRIATDLGITPEQASWLRCQALLERIAELVAGTDAASREAA